MIICSCNVLRETDLKPHCRPDILSTEQLYACLGCKVQCGKCAEYIESMLLCATPKAH